MVNPWGPKQLEPTSLPEARREQRKEEELSDTPAKRPGEDTWPSREEPFEECMSISNLLRLVYVLLKQ